MSGLCDAELVDPRSGKVGWRCVKLPGHAGKHGNRGNNRTWTDKDAGEAKDTWEFFSDA